MRFPYYLAPEVPGHSHRICMQIRQSNAKQGSYCLSFCITTEGKSGQEGIYTAGYSISRSFSTGYMGQQQPRDRERRPGTLHNTRQTTGESNLDISGHRLWKWT